MPVTNSHAVTSALGPLGTNASGSMTVVATNVGTTPAKIALPTPTEGQIQRSVYRCKITNGHASQRLAWQIVERGAAAPSFNANFAASAGVIILPGTSEYVNLLANRDLYLVGSAAATDYCVSVELE